MKTASVSTHFSSRARYAEKSSKIKEDIVRSFPALSLDCNAQDISDLLKIMEDIQLAVNAGDGENLQVIGALQNRLTENRALPQDSNKVELMKFLIMAATHKPGVLSHFSLIKKEKFNYFSSTNYTNTMSQLQQKISSQYQINADGSFYVGQMEKNITSNTWLAHGRGSQTYPNGIKYTGDFKFGIPNGCGIFTYPNGSEYSTYTGDVASGMPHGKGTITYQNGSTYTGGVKFGMKHGKGIFEENPNDPNGYRYEGEWQNDKFHGKGTITYKSGYRYAGNFYSGIFLHSQGSETYFNKTTSTGHSVISTSGPYDFPETTPNLYQMNKDASDAAMMSFFIQEVIQSDW